MARFFPTPCSMSRTHGLPWLHPALFLQKSNMFSIFQQIHWQKLGNSHGHSKGSAVHTEIWFQWHWNIFRRGCLLPGGPAGRRTINLREVNKLWLLVSHLPRENERFFLHYKNTTGTYTQSMLNLSGCIPRREIENRRLEDFMGCECLGFMIWLAVGYWNSLFLPA